MAKNKVPFFLAAEYLIEHGSITYEDFKEKFCKDTYGKYDNGIHKSMVRSKLIIHSDPESLNDCMILSPEGISVYLANKAIRQHKSLAMKAIVISITAIIVSVLTI